MLKHHGHSEYTGRFSGTSWCEAYYALYDVRDKRPDVLGDPCLWKKEGRWSKKCLKEIETVIKEREINENQ